ncbi:MAG TPA: aminodeoxychorismate/anthranilate synthase component II [Fluviicola sp.]|nr:aminodeoxychorismate/anthranilate synthase component II [Fluviicola sp.]
MRILLLDNIDSFTYNIYHYLEALGAEVAVIDHTVVEPGNLQQFDALVISPGPGLPHEAGRLMEVLAEAVRLQLPTLGVCLGMQAIAEYFGGKIFNQQQVQHGQQATVNHTNESLLFQGIPTRFQVGLYHSWAVDENLPSQLIATAFSEHGIMMALEHRSLPVYGVQFHPESVLSEYGMELFGNFLGRV